MRVVPRHHGVAGLLESNRLLQVAQGSRPLILGRGRVRELRFGAPPIEHRQIRLQGDGPAELLDRRVRLVLPKVERRQLAVGLVPAFIEPDRFLPVRLGLIPLPALEVRGDRG